MPVVGYVVPYELRPGELSNFSADAHAEIDHEEERLATSLQVSRPRQLVFLLGGIAVNTGLAILLLSATGIAPERAVEKTTTSILAIWASAPNTLMSLVDPDLYTSDRKGLLRSMADARSRGGSMLHLTAILNIVVVAFNLLPIPGLDGFKSLMTVVGAIMRRDVSFAAIAPFKWLTGALIVFLIVSSIYLLGRDILLMLW